MIRQVCEMFYSSEGALQNQIGRYLEKFPDRYISSLSLSHYEVGYGLKWQCAVVFDIKEG